MSDGSEIKARIASITETKKVTDAMYMISSVKMNRARREVANTAPFFGELKQEIGELIDHVSGSANRYFREPEPDADGHVRRGVLLVTSDKGLAGEYNHSAIALCEETLRRHPQVTLFILGEFGRQYFASKGVPFVGDFRYSAELPTVWKARRICADLLDYFDSGRVGEIEMICADYPGGGDGKCRRSVLLPLSRSHFARSAAGRPETEFIPDPDTVLNGIIPSYLTGFIYSSLVDSYCGEQQARMEAMSAAGRNAEEMLRELRLRYNRVRQAAVTREMTEITSGARALKRREPTP